MIPGLGNEWFAMTHDPRQACVHAEFEDRQSELHALA
jgi:hypothetical protein